MNLNNLFEAVRKEYYDMNILKVATEFPLELLRMFFDIFEKSVGEIATENKKEIIEEYKNKIDGKVNPWLDGRNDNNIIFDFEDVYKRKQSSGSASQHAFRSEDNTITVNFVGSKAGVVIQNKEGRTRTSSEATMWNTSSTVREFFDKIINYYKKLQSGNFSEEDRLNPDLFSQKDKKVILLNKMWNKHYLSVSGGSHSKVSENYIDVKVDYSSFGNKFQYGKFAIREDVNYSFQIDLLKKFSNEFKKFMNNKNFTITNIIKENKGLKYYYYYSENPEEETPRDSNWTYSRKQKEAFNSLDSLLKGYEVVEMTFPEFKQDVVKNIFKVV